MKTKIYTTFAQILNANDLKLPKVNADASQLNNILNFAFFAAGALSTVFIVVGGLKYVLSAGKPDEAKKAKETILYAVIGLVVTIFSYAIVGFVVGQL